MSWFDAAGFATLAKSALNTAQKTIDKALDIREESVLTVPAVVTPQKPDVDTFFESFGLGPKGSSPSLQNQPSPSGEKSSGSLQNVGFWSDAWGSFFESKAPAPEPLQASKSSEPDPVPLSPKKTFPGMPAVSSQPQRAGLFPGDVKPLPESSCSSQDKTLSSDQSDIEIKSSENIPETKKCDSLVPASNVSPKQESEMPSDDSKPVLVMYTAESENDSAQSVTIDETNSESVVLPESEVNVSDAISDSNKQESLEISSTDCNNPAESSEYKVCTSAPVIHCADVSESYVNLENSILNKSTFTKLYTSDTVEVPKPTDSIHSPSVPSLSVQDEIPGCLTDSFQVLDDPAMPHESVWVMDMPDECVIRGSEDHQSQSGDAGSSSSKDDCEIEMKDCDVKSLGSGRSQEMASSFVKCSIDDVEDSCHRGQSPMSTTTSERSDLTKLESEQNTSGDENETTTSSDIEILSPPNGENGERNSSPLKHVWVPRTIRLRGSESPASDCSKDNIMPMVREGEESAAQESRKGLGIYYCKPEKDFSHKRYEGIDLDKVFQHQDELQTLLEAREKRIMELSTENLKLHESEEKLQNQVCELKLNLARESQNLSSVTKDLTQRMAQIERQAQKAIKERDSLKVHFEETQAELAQRVSISQMEEVVKEKDQQIEELMGEGQKLSKKELQHTTIIKKLRVKEDEMEHSIKSLKEKMEENNKEVDRLRRSLRAKDEQEKTHIDRISQFNSTVTKQEKEIASLKSNLEDCKERELTTKKSLDSTYKELTELQKKNAIKDKEISELQLSVEMAAKEKLREGLDQASREASREKEMLRIQMEELRNSLKRCESEANQREKSLKEDISRLQLRLQEAESRNEELTKNILTSTRPLVRQIETLQASYNAQMSNWEKVEKSLSDRLNDVQNQLLLCSAREKLVNEKCQEFSVRSAKLETENKVLHQEKIHLISELEAINSKVDLLEENKNSNLTSVDSLKHNLTLEMNKLKDEKDKIAKELENRIELLKEERMQNQNLQEELRNKDNRLQALDNLSPCPSPSASLRSSVDSINNWNQDDNQEKRMPAQLSSYRLSVYDSLTKTGCTTSILENLQSQLKQREGEISQLQCEITKLERERESVAQELVEVASQNEELLEKLERLTNIEKQHRDLRQKYNALLQMYNEKVEEYEALQLDLADVKSAYRRQIEELLEK